MVTISVITPTIGRASLKDMLDLLLPQLEPGDECLIIGDGPQPNAKAIVDCLANPAVVYFEHGPIWNYGNPQRNLAIARAKGKFLHFVDDDDRPIPGGIALMKNAIARVPDKPHMFKMHHKDRILWGNTAIAMGNISGQMFVPPNTPDRLGRWSGNYAADFDFIRSTLSTYPEGQSAVVWESDVIVVQGYHGEGHGIVLP